MSATPRDSTLRGFRALLSVPLFLKLVLANAVVVVIALLAGALVVSLTGAPAAVVAVLVILNSMIVNAVIVTIALLPLNREGGVSALLKALLEHACRCAEWRAAQGC